MESLSPRSKRPKSCSRCYLCGNPIKDRLSKDHVPPKCFFPKSHRQYLSDLITLNTHEKCNNSYKDDEEYMALSLGAAARATKSGSALFEDFRSWGKRPPGRDLIKRVLGEFSLRPGLLHLPPGMASKTVDSNRVSRVAWKIAGNATSFL